MINVKDLKIGDTVYSEHTGNTYIIACLPNLIFGIDKYALIRNDGCGYCYLKDTLDEVRKEIYNSGELMYRVRHNGHEEFEEIEGI